VKRVYRKRSAFSVKRLGPALFTLFVVYIAYKILTPPSHVLMERGAPDGTMTARLRAFYYYDGLPSYKLDYRKKEKLVWLNLYYLPAYTNIPADSAEPGLQWSDDSERLDFLMNGTSIWHHSFQP
jgi:hypothetical protein